jgi:cytochrome c-type biogenesis protein CcsB
MSPVYAIVYWLTCVVYAAVVATQIFGLVFHRQRLVERAVWGIAGGLALHTALVAWRWAATGHFPTIGDFENALFGGWFIGAGVLWAAWRQRFPVVAAAGLPFALVIMGWGALGNTAESPLLASLNTLWLFIHVFFAWLAYGSWTVACAAAIVYLVQSSPARPQDLEKLGRLDELMLRTTAFGFVTDAVMIAAGAIWAKNLWGSYWSWDPVETWSLISFLIYGLVLHLRVTLGWRGRRISWILVFAIVTVLVTFWGVNVVMSGSRHLFNVG